MRTFAYTDTQRYRVGPNRLQLPINAPRCPYATKQRGGQMSYHVDGAEQGADLHINYESSNHGGLRGQARPGPPPRSFWQGEVGRQRIARTKDFAQAGDRWRAFSDAGRDELVTNLVGAPSQCLDVVRQRMVGHFTKADPESSHRMADGVRRTAS